MTFTFARNKLKFSNAFFVYVFRLGTASAVTVATITRSFAAFSFNDSRNGDAYNHPYAKNYQKYFPNAHKITLLVYVLLICRFSALSQELPTR